MYTDYHLEGAKKEQARRTYYEKKEKAKLHEEWYEKFGGERAYYENYYKKFMRHCDSSGVSLVRVSP